MKKFVVAYRGVRFFVSIDFMAGQIDPEAAPNQYAIVNSRFPVI